MTERSKTWPERIFDATLVLGAVAVVLATLGNCLAAFIFPLEIEIKEGTSWLHVITMEAGVSLYDHHRVAFVNMNHGPMDPILKYAIHRLMPFLTPGMVTRFFVPLLPLGILAAMCRALPGRWTVAVFCTGWLYLFLLGLTSFQFLIGRSDPAATFFLALMLVAADFAARAANRGRLASSARFFAVGLLGSMVLLTNWRFFAFVGGCGLAWILEAAWNSADNVRAKLLSLLCHLGGLVLGLFTPFLLVLVLVFHGNFTLYFLHFFGFFMPDSGWGVGRDIPYSFFPKELLFPRWPAHILLLIGLGLAMAFPAQRTSRKVQLLIWWPMLIALWYSTTYAFFVNHMGGGLYYFGPFYIVLAFQVARSVDWERVQVPWISLSLLALALCGVPWHTAWRQMALLEENMRPAGTFLSEARRLTRGSRVQSEEAYFFEMHYGGEVIDIGDSVSRIYPTGYYGDDFGATAQAYFDGLQAKPPPFIMTVGAQGDSISVNSPVLRDLVKRLYVPILTAPDHLWPNGGGRESLYRLKKTIPSVP